mmetsp:Transcript_4242/g.7152  ORF Transcript_4242/g.7152 Transcript_4242/m.7152 type:complete len:221 (-) Transcript_4242:1405-2067(-)
MCLLRASGSTELAMRHHVLHAATDVRHRGVPSRQAGNPQHDIVRDTCHGTFSITQPAVVHDHQLQHLFIRHQPQHGAAHARDPGNLLATSHSSPGSTDQIADFQGEVHAHAVAPLVIVHVVDDIEEIHIDLTLSARKTLQISPQALLLHRQHWMFLTAWHLPSLQHGIGLAQRRHEGRHRAAVGILVSHAAKNTRRHLGALLQLDQTHVQRGIGPPPGPP